MIYPERYSNIDLI